MKKSCVYLFGGVFSCVVSSGLWAQGDQVQAQTSSLKSEQTGDHVVAQLVDQHMTQNLGGDQGSLFHHRYKNAIEEVKAKFPDDPRAQRIALTKLEQHYHASKEAISKRGDLRYDPAYQHGQINRALKEFDGHVQARETELAEKARQQEVQRAEQRLKMMGDVKREGVAAQEEKQKILQAEHQKQLESHQQALEKKKAQIADRKRQKEEAAGGAQPHADHHVAEGDRSGRSDTPPTRPSTPVFPASPQTKHHDPASPVMTPNKPQVHQQSSAPKTTRAQQLREEHLKKR